MHGHDILEDNTSVYTSQEEMIVESIEALHSKEKERSETFINQQSSRSFSIASENFENSNTSLTSGENSKIFDFSNILVPVQPLFKLKRKFTSSSSISRDIRFKGDQSERGFKQPRMQRFHAAFGAHLNTNQNFQNYQN